MARQIASDEVMAIIASPTDFPYAMVFYDDTIVRVSTLRCTPTSSLGPFEKLPPELNWEIGNLLDFQSLSRLSRVSVKAKEMVESFPAYRDMMEHASMALTALSQTGLLRRHSAGSLQQTLRSDKCDRCRNKEWPLDRFGPFLHLPTCQRACQFCLEADSGLWMLDKAKVEQLFGVPMSITNQLPKMRLTGRRFTPEMLRALVPNATNEELPRIEHLLCDWGCRPGRDEVVSVQHVRDFLKTCKDPRLGFLFLNDLDGFEEAMFTEDIAQVCRDMSGGIGSVHFPFLAEYGAEYGLRCRACVVRDAEHLYDYIHTRSDVLEHIKKCEHAQGLLESCGLSQE